MFYSLILALLLVSSVFGENISNEIKRNVKDLGYITQCQTPGNNFRALY